MFTPTTGIYRRFFTLIELLVVIAIISILAAMLLPTLSNARTAAYSAVCTSNMKQVMTVAQLYDTDHQIIVPSQVGYYKVNIVNQNYAGLLFLYEEGYLDRAHVVGVNSWSDLTEERLAGQVRGSSLLVCPRGHMVNEQIAPHKNTNLPTDPVWDTQEGYRRWSYAGGNPSWYTGTGSASIISSYAINSNLRKEITPVPDPSLAAGGQTYHEPIKNFAGSASEKIYLIESHNTGFAAGSFRNEVNAPSGLSPSYGRYWRAIRFAHGNSVNYACYDGHVAKLNKHAFLPFNNASVWTSAIPTLPFNF